MIMRTYFAICLVLLITCVSCNNDDDAGPVVDPIVGVWKPFKAFEAGVADVLTPCQQEDRLRFNENGSLNFKFYHTQADGSCELIEDQDGTWSREGERRYTTVYDFFPYQPDTHDFYFESNTFYFEYSDFQSTNDPTMVLHKKVFIKVE